MILSKITAKSQTTIPRAVRIALGVKPGDALAYRIEGDVVTVTVARDRGADGFVGNFSTFWEWDTDADREGYADL